MHPDIAPRRWNFGVIDAHAHIAPELVDRAIQLMDANGITAVVNLSGAFDGQLSAELRAFKRYPDRIYTFAGVDFRGFGEASWLSHACQQLERAVYAGAVGLKFHKSLGLIHHDCNGKLIPVDDERLAPVIEKAGELGIPVAFHTADPRAFFEPFNEDNERWEELRLNPHWWFGDRSKYPYDWWTLLHQLENVIKRHCNVIIIGVHFGNSAEELDYVASLLERYPNYYVDVAARLGEIGRHDVERVRDIFIRFQDRILFGTDLGVREPLMLGAPQGFKPTDEDVRKFYNSHWRFFETSDSNIPHPIPIQGRWMVNAINLPREVLAKLYRRNAERIILKR
ncbi:MAG TPA: amidohydrolase [Armatimonadetes bacterium]|nr:amidohydrolase [Armatimonadota bacterium]